mmetsp:Transcript_8838/g.17149  ORF Transcript_8838/g.17149 Transcript_8838/m.17149 type:complete len:83 (+) Transcript_8838:59-307(+)
MLNDFASSFNLRKEMPSFTLKGSKLLILYTLERITSRLMNAQSLPQSHQKAGSPLTPYNRENCYSSLYVLDTIAIPSQLSED